MNNRYEIEVAAPLLRPGMTIRTTCSEKYVVDVTQVLMDMVRQVNHPVPPEGAGDCVIAASGARFPIPKKVSPQGNTWRSGSVKDDG